MEEIFMLNEVFVVTTTSVNSPQDDSPTSEGDDPLYSIAVYASMELANSAAKTKLEDFRFDDEDLEIEEDDGYTDYDYPKGITTYTTKDGAVHYQVNSSYQVYRIDVNRLPIRSTLPTAVAGW